jgi:hypothetical protein
MKEMAQGVRAPLQKKQQRWEWEKQHAHPRNAASDRSQNVCCQELCKQTCGTHKKKEKRNKKTKKKNQGISDCCKTPSST